MTHFLLFTLYAPMGSLGQIAVGERRMGWARPGRSAILGLIAAALGIERVDEAAHRNLETGFFYAVRTDAPGRPFIDYHTAQTPKARRGRMFATRREELDADDLHTVLSSREWRSDVCFTIALWPRHDQAVNLSEIVDALRHPVSLSISAARQHLWACRSTPLLSKPLRSWTRSRPGNLMR